MKWESRPKEKEGISTFILYHANENKIKIALNLMKIKFKNQFCPLLHLYESTFKNIMRKSILEVDNADFQLTKKTSSANFVVLKF
jgi:hypothetical protein